MLIIAAHRLNRSPSQRFRFEQYLDYLAQNGVECTLSPIISASDDVHFYSPGRFGKKLWILMKAYTRRWQNVLACGKYDAVLIQREAIMTRTTMFERLLAWRRPVIFDFDDAIWKMDVSDANQRLKWMKNPAKTAKLIKLAQQVIAGNAYLQQYALQYNPRTVIIPTTVDTGLFIPPAVQLTGSVVTIGWSGSKTTIKHFETAVPVLLRIRQKYGNRVRFSVIGEPAYAHAGLGIQGVAWQSATEVSELQKINIGIMPLPDDEWAKGKCGLKGLTYMSLEIPTVMSHVGVNTEIIQHGENGFLYRTDEELYTLLCTLIEDESLRQTIGRKGRETVVDRYSVKANGQKYLEVIRQAISK